MEKSDSVKPFSGFGSIETLITPKTVEHLNSFFENVFKDGYRIKEIKFSLASRPWFRKQIKMDVQYGKN